MNNGRERYEKPWELWHEDALTALPRIPDDSIDGIVTSPPYADQRQYGDHPPGEGRTTRKNASRKQRLEAPAKAAAWLEPFLHELLRVCSPTGSLALNLGIVMRGFEETDWCDDVLRRCRAMGWKLLQRMVWHKPNGVPLSEPAYLHVKHEYVLWLARDARAAYRGFDKDTRTEHSETSVRRINQAYIRRKDERYGSRSTRHQLHPDGARPATVFTAGVGSQSVDHPAPMPPKLALQLVSLTTPKGGLVLDPFAGSATTGLACIERGRRFLGIEENARYVEEATRRLQLGRFPSRARPPLPHEAQMGLL